MCGLFGYIGNKKVPINKFLLCTLGVDNDSRGGDSCGIFIDGKYEYGIEKKKYFENFYPESTLLKETKQASIVLGHDRKTSVGKTTLETAQPVIIRDANSNKIDFVLIHNGTINNYKELAEKYLTSYEGLTDSQIMAYIMYYWGYDVLSEYEGTGAFVTVDYRQNKQRKPITHIFKGCSKQYTSSSYASEERPLYMVNEGDGYWFSSINSFLNTYAYANNLEVVDIPTNTLILISEGKLFKVHEYDRTEKVQKIVSNITYNNKNTSNNQYNQYNQYNLYNYCDDYDDLYQLTPISFSKDTNKEKELSDFINDFELPFELPSDIDSMTNLEIISKINKSITPVNLLEGHVTYQDLYYTDGLTPLNGVYMLDTNGKKNTTGINMNYCFSFIDGSLLYHPKILYSILILSDFLDCYPADVFNLLEKDISKYSTFPFFDEKFNCYFDYNGSCIDYRTYTPLFQPKNNVIRLIIQKGELTEKAYDYSNYDTYDPMDTPYKEYRTKFELFDKVKLSNIIKEIYGSLTY